MKRRTKNNRVLIHQYIIDAIDSSGYTDKPQPTDVLGKLQFVWDTFNSEYGHPHNLKRYGNEQETFANWLMGLPSCFNIDFEDYRILEKGIEWGLISQDESEAKQGQFINQWFRMIHMEYKGMLTRGVPKAKAERKTVDEYQVQGYYSGQWEVVTAEETKSDAKDRLSEYRINEPNTAFRLVKKHIKK